MKNNHKKLIASIALVGTMAAGGTFALLQTNTGTATNNFTSSKNISGILYEDNLGDEFKERTIKTDDEETNVTHITGGTWKDYLPTQTQTKDPTIKIYKKSVPAYVGMKVKYIINNEAVSKDDFNNRLATLYTTGTDDNKDGINDKWTQSAVANNEYFYTYADIVSPGTTTEALFDGITINKDIKDANSGSVTASLPAFKIEVEGYAVQSEGTANSHIDDLKALAEIK